MTWRYTDDLLSELINQELVDKYLFDICNTYHKMKLSKSDNIIIQKGGEIKEFDIDNKKVKVDIHIGKLQKYDDDGIGGNEYDEKLIILGMHKEDREYRCAVLLFNSKTKTANIRSLSKRDYCVKCKDKDYKVGDILVKILLNFCKDRGIENIQLLDNSYTMINDNSFSLLILRILTHGKTYYNKYKFYQIDDHRRKDVIYKHNKALFKKLLIKDVFLSKLVRDYYDPNIMKIDKKLEERVNSFIDNIFKNNNLLLGEFILKYINSYSDIFENIYMDLYNLAGYKQYKSNIFLKN